MGLGSTFKKIGKQISKASGGLIPSSWKGAVNNAITIGTLGLAGDGTLPSLQNSLGGNSFLGNLLGNVVNGAVGLSNDYTQAQINLAAQKDLAKYTAQQQSKLNEEAFQRNLQQWNLENQYNSPSEQMKRYEEAGLNPNLIYDKQNLSASSPTLQPATYDPGHYNPVDTRIQRAQLALALESQHQQIINQAIQNDLDRQRLVLSAQASKREDALAQAQIKNMSANLGLRYDEFNYNMDSPKSWIGRNWQDIKSIGKEAFDFIRKSVNSSNSSYRYNPMPMYRGNH